MKFKISRSSAGCCAAALALIAVGWSGAQADGVDPNIDLTNAMCGPATQPQQPQISYAAKPGDVLANANPPAQIGVKGAPGNVFWALSQSAGCFGGLQSIQCGPSVPNTTMDPIFSVVAPDDNGTTGHPATVPVQISNVRPITIADVGRSGVFGATVSTAPNADKSCNWKYLVHVISAGGGWGDPHMTTVDGVHYDFQSAGEFTALREDDFEVQTRQRPVPTTTVPGPSEYTGLGVCVSTYSAVALRIGSNRISLQPNLSGQPDPSGLQLRVNGKLVSLTDSGIDLRAGGNMQSSVPLEGRITKAAGGAYEFTNARGTQLVATPAYWDAQQTWYMNLNVYQTSATRGIWGRLAADSWLPALPNGTSLGPKPESLSRRYEDLYGKFADAWRVTDATSLFDYQPGTNTATFARKEWPRFNPESCAIEGQTSAQPTTQEVAAQACRAIANAAQKADCIFDVTITGETGFAQAYRTMQDFQPHGTGWQPVLAGVGESSPPGQGLPWWWMVILILVLIIIVLLIAGRTRAA
jgi:hypothetical protein